ncbi:MAG: diacylglycerol kinase family lipid kinase [Candidatus Izimaplasma sp.]|nr:diacylglycerol kinase family lipid kinase [Candidatus Izimaplasma bacterium]
MLRCQIIYNPESGKRDFVNYLDYVESRLIKAGYQVDIVATKKQKHAIDLAKKACEEKYDLLVISGGDGTLHECINGIAVSQYKPKIGYIPSGTACDLASTLKIPKNVSKAVDIILTGVPVKMDIVKSTNGYFMYVTAIGTYVDISYVTNSKFKRYFGYFAYIFTGIKEFFTIPMIKTEIIHDKGIYKGYFSLILVINSQKIAGFDFVNRPILDDGKVDVIIYRYIPFINNFLYFLSIVSGPRVLPFVHRFRTSKLDVYTNHPHKWNMDGEESKSGNLNIEVVKQAIEIIVKPSVKVKCFKEQNDEKTEN